MYENARNEENENFMALKFSAKIIRIAKVAKSKKKKVEEGSQKITMNKIWGKKIWRTLKSKYTRLYKSNKFAKKHNK